jgi:hypothetical protein
MSYLFLAAFVAGLLLAVRIMFFGAERRHARRVDGLLLRRSEPAVVGFLVMFGVAGYLLTRHGAMTVAAGTGVAFLLGLLWAALVTRLAIATARIQPEHDPDDPRYVLQGHVAVVTSAIPANGQGSIALGDGTEPRSLRARSIDANPIDDGVEVCIERVEDDVAYVELWALVEARL